MFYFFLIALFFIVLISIGIIVYSRFKDLKEFRGDRLIEVPFIRRILDRIIPETGTKTDLKYKDYLFVLTDSVTIRDMWFCKLLCLIIGFFLALTIVGTNSFSSYNACFNNITKDVPINISREEYKTLSSGLTFDESKEDVRLIDKNLVLLGNSSSNKFTGLTNKDLYDYISSIHKNVTKSVGIMSLLTLLILTWLCWFIPNIVVSGLFEYIKNNALVEFDNLETIISIMRNEKIPVILDALEYSSLFYRTMLFHFYDMYEANSADAFAVIEQNDEFPVKFKRLIRYIEMLSAQGPDYVKLIIDSNKDQTEQELFDKQFKITHKRLGRLKLILTIAFILSMVNVMVSMFSGMLGM